MEQFANNAATTLSGAVTNSQTTITVTSAVKFPTSGTFRVIVDSEIMIVTGVSGNIFTVTRGAEGTVAASHVSLALVTCVLTAGSLAAILAYVLNIPYNQLGSGVQSLSAVTSWVSTVNQKCVTATREPVNVQTTSATAATLDQFSPPSVSCGLVTYDVTAVRSDGGQAGAWSVAAAFRNVNGTITMLGNPIVTAVGTPSDTTWAPTVDISGTWVRLRVPGKASITIQYGASGNVQTTVP